MALLPFEKEFQKSKSSDRGEHRTPDNSWQCDLEFLGALPSCRTLTSRLFFSRPWPNLCSFQTGFLCPSYQGDCPVIFQHKTQPVAFIFLKPPLSIYVFPSPFSEAHAPSEGKCRVHWSLSTHNSTVLALSSWSIFSEQQKEKKYAGFQTISLFPQRKKEKKKLEIYTLLCWVIYCIFKQSSEDNLRKSVLSLPCRSQWLSSRSG